jgi:hypothetical protein
MGGVIAVLEGYSNEESFLTGEELRLTFFRGSIIGGISMCSINVIRSCQLFIPFVCCLTRNQLQCVVLQAVVSTHCFWRGISRRRRRIWSTMSERILLFNKYFVGRNCMFHCCNRSSILTEQGPSAGHIFCHIVCLQRYMVLWGNCIGSSEWIFMPGLVAEQELLAPHCDFSPRRYIRQPRSEICSEHSPHARISSQIRR